MNYRISHFACILFLICITAGCDTARDEFESFDSAKMDALSIEDQKYKQEFVNQLKKRSIDYAEMRVLDNSLYIVTRKSDKAVVTEIYRDVIGERPSRFSISPTSSAVLNQIKILLKANEIKYKEGKFYGLHYVEWSPSDDKLARSLADEALAIE